MNTGSLNGFRALFFCISWIDFWILFRWLHGLQSHWGWWFNGLFRVLQSLPVIFLHITKNWMKAKQLFYRDHGIWESGSINIWIALSKLTRVLCGFSIQNLNLLICQMMVSYAKICLNFSTVYSLCYLNKTMHLSWNMATLFLCFLFLLVFFSSFHFLPVYKKTWNPACIASLFLFCANRAKLITKFVRL